MNTLNNNVKAQALKLLAPEPSNQTLNNVLRWFCKWRSSIIAKTWITKQGLAVYAGPFQGMTFLDRSQEGCHLPKLIGCYEQPIHEDLQRLLKNSYGNILNIGSAEGYYSVGLAKMAPNTTVVACDTNPKAVDACKQLAAKNHVGNIEYHPEFTPGDFEKYSNGRTLVVCDIEGGEDDLLDPSKAIELSGMDIIVESHDCFIPGLTQKLIERFSTTHAIKLIEDNGTRSLPMMPGWFHKIPNLDQLMCTWEWRSGPTPWLIMEAK